MKKPFKINKTDFWISIGLAIVIIFAITTSIILNARQKRLDELKKQNELISPTDKDPATTQKIILKNFEIFIDKELLF